MLHNDPIQNMIAIGAVSSRTARIWLRAQQPGIYQLSCRPGSGAGRGVSLPVRLDDEAADLTGAVTLSEGLEPDTRYVVALTAGPATLATGTFQTAPLRERPPTRAAIALMSCHQPFHPDGTVAPGTGPMLEAVNRVLREHEVRAVVMGGDQMYSDLPPSASLLDPQHFREVAPPGRSDLLECSAAEVRRLFQQRYRHFWSIPGWRAMLAGFPCYPILDDHEIIDNWGSAEAHGTARWQAFREGAFQAYADYQGSRVCEQHARVPDSFDYEFELADTATHVMDLRSRRRAGEHAQLLSPRQVDAFRSFLTRHADKHVLFVVLSVPLLHLPRALSRLAARLTPDGEDFSDRWSARAHRRDRDRMLQILHDHQHERPDQRIVLLSGDIHIGCVHEIHWRGLQPGRSRPCLYQFVSSGVTHDAGTFMQWASGALIRANRSITARPAPERALRARLRLLRGEPGADRNPCGRLNVGIVELTRASPDAWPQLRFLLYSHRGSEPLCLYRSPPIPPQTTCRASCSVTK